VKENGMSWNWSTAITVVTVVGYLVPFVMLFILPANRKPSSATAWLLLMFALPFVGLLLFGLIGNPKLPRRRRAQQHTIDDQIALAVSRARSDPAQAALLDPPIPPRYEPYVRLTTNLGKLAAFAGNAVELLSDYADALARIAAEIHRAQRFVHVEYFIIALDKATEDCFVAMEQAAKRGVKVRVLMDHLGAASYPNYKQMKARLDAAGIEWRLMLPLRFPGSRFTRPDLRNHRKIVVVDGATAFTGSQNMIDKTYHKKGNLKKGLYYTELVARLTGPIVREFEAAFVADWYSETDTLLDASTAPETRAEGAVATGDVLCQVMPSGSSYDTENNLKLYTALFYGAHQQIVIANPYFVPDDALMTAITSAAERGVDVSLITSQIGDQFLVFHAQRSYYEQLLRAGVKIFLYRSPVLLHSKHMAIDDDIAAIGSSNLDLRSFTLNFEVTLLCYDRQVVSDMQQVFRGYLARAIPLRLEEWQTRSLYTRLLENIARLTAALQ
jgi:cardiolipin synthase